MHKLKNQQGATLMMALLLLLAASMVSAVILTAATSSARRLENDRAARQAYLTVSSAARLLRDDILNASFVQETVKTTYTNDTSTETSRETTSPTGFTAAWLKAGKAAVDRDSGKALPTPSPYPWTGWMMSPPSLPWRPITTSPSSCTWPTAATVTAAWC